MSYWQYGLSPQVTFTVSNGEMIQGRENRRHAEWKKENKTQQQHTGLQGGYLRTHDDHFIVKKVWHFKNRHILYMAMLGCHTVTLLEMWMFRDLFTHVIKSFRKYFSSLRILKGPKKSPP
jgi:hypothetical protein